MNPLVVLGVTGSIGRQSLDVAKELDVPIGGVAASRGSASLLDIALEWPEARVAVANPTADELTAFKSRLGSRVDFGADAVAAMAAEPGTTVINGIVGAAGLAPSLAAAEAGNRLALANKESLVAGGDVMAGAVSRGGGEIIPVDSEHSAVWQCLVGEASPLRRVILTASGGPFRGRSRSDLGGVTVADTLAHPTWSMGARISVDSATLMNKAFEVIEAHYLFNVGYDVIDVVVHPQSIIHSMVEFVDGSVKAQLGDPDMRLPIQYAVTYPQRSVTADRHFDITKQDLTFEAPDTATFGLLELGYAAGRAAGSAPAVLNAADEEAVAAFLDERIGFLDIERVVAKTLEQCQWRAVTTVDDVLDVDAEARRVAARYVEEIATD